MPRYSLVTSRGSTETMERKRGRYALLCYTDEPLTKLADRQNAVDAARFVNLRTGRPLGASQVTAVVSRRRKRARYGLQRCYPVTVTAQLDAPEQVQLTHPVVLEASVIQAPEDIASRNNDIAEWKVLVDEIKHKYLVGRYRAMSYKAQREITFL
jgi:hypothetical protein